LKANQGEAGPGWTDRVIAEALEVHPATVARVRQYYATAGLDAALYAKPPRRDYRPVIEQPEVLLGYLQEEAAAAVWTRLSETRAWIGPVQVRRGPDHLR
jgi:hypothetical protein